MITGQIDRGCTPGLVNAVVETVSIMEARRQRRPDAALAPAPAVPVTPAGPGVS
jgi:hypothetical protein